MDLQKKLDIITKACEDKKGIDLKVLNITKLTPIADYFVIVSGNSSTQVMSIADEVEDKMLQAGSEEIIKEGYQSGRWILLDFNDIIVHVFHKEEREFYDLERLWSKEEEINNQN
ncbi:ribosome silencing factor [Tissierella sp. MB52-C2]|uniref:ribosome silencing factor n=1 Tax=Tissierella sp. MB52-C2 TaxID=3070999 RepID=UPI00280C0C26|nr:ribosome silencing factor [Tissierella sp. MB52-C2]WMM26990.1 ribosome silencing factor [Tissierella sp. MB52-C2]